MSENTCPNVALSRNQNMWVVKESADKTLEFPAVTDIINVTADVLSMTIHAETLGRHRACVKARLFRETEAPDAPDAAVVPLYPLVSSERSHLPGLAASFTALR